MRKFKYSEKATKFCKIFPLLLTTLHTVKSKRKISQNLVAFSEYMNFTTKGYVVHTLKKKAIFSYHYIVVKYLWIYNENSYGNTLSKL